MGAQNEGQQLVQDLKAKENKDFRDSVANSSLVLVCKGLWLFAEGASALGLAAFGIYQAHFGNYAHLWRYILTIAGVVVLVPAAVLLGRFFRTVGKS